MKKLLEINSQFKNSVWFTFYPVRWCLCGTFSSVWTYWGSISCFDLLWKENSNWVSVFFEQTVGPISSVYPVMFSLAGKRYRFKEGWASMASLHIYIHAYVCCPNNKNEHSNITIGAKAQMCLNWGAFRTINFLNLKLFKIRKCLLARGSFYSAQTKKKNNKYNIGSIQPKLQDL